MEQRETSPTAAPSGRTTTRCRLYQRLALRDRDHSSRHPHAAGNVGDSERVGRGDDRSERERGRPREAEPTVGDGCNARHRPPHETDGEQRDRPQVRAEVAQRGEEGSRVEQRGQQRDEHDVRRQHQMRQAGDEAERDASEDEQHRHRQPQRRRQREQRAEGQQQPQKLNLLVCPAAHKATLRRCRRPYSLVCHDGPMDQRPSLLYDADCRVCRFVARVAVRLDRRGRVTYLPLQDSEAMRLLVNLTHEQRMASIHLVEADGQRLSAEAALASLLGHLGIPVRPARLIGRLYGPVAAPALLEDRPRRPGTTAND